MTIRNSRLPRILVSAAVVAAGVVGAAGAGYSKGPRLMDERAVWLGTVAERAFPDAPAGVDPMVTGPTSASFKKRQATSDCAEAVWPNIPLDCYPNR
jgi:hypothetical protein